MTKCPHYGRTKSFETCDCHGELPEGQNNSKSSWMIEKTINGTPHWWVIENGQHEHWDNPNRWTSDPNKGRKYDTKADAEYVMGGQMIGCVATEHIWMDMPRKYLIKSNEDK